MSSFFAAALALLALASVFVIWPLRHRHHPPEQAESDAQARERQAQNVAVFKDRVAELDALRDAGEMTDADHAQAVEALQINLLQEVGEQAPARSQGLGNRALFGAGLVLLLTGASIGLYQEWGAGDDIRLTRLLNAFTQLEPSEEGAFEALLTQLDAHMSAHPDKPDGWNLLAQSYARMGRYNDASRAFRGLTEALEQLDQPSASAYALLAQSIYLSNQQTITDAVRVNLDKAIALDPQDATALGLLGIDAFQGGRYEEAIAHWQEVLKRTRPGPGRDALESGIAAARERLGANADAANGAAPQTSADGSGASVTVAVSVADHLRQQIEPNDTLFVFARASDGPPLPLAVARFQAKDLPLNVTLDDTMAMAPGVNLSSADKVDIVARISKSGEPIASTGDVQGAIAAVTLAEAAALTLTIDQVVP